MQLASRRSGTASTKTRSDVRGGGKKPWRQKGTGRARAGTTRSPIWRGGGIVFGPHPRDYSYSIPKKVRKKAVISALSMKFKDNKMNHGGLLTEINVYARALPTAPAARTRQRRHSPPFPAAPGQTPAPVHGPHHEARRRRLVAEPALRVSYNLYRL